MSVIDELENIEPSEEELRAIEEGTYKDPVWAADREVDFADEEDYRPEGDE